MMSVCTGHCGNKYDILYISNPSGTDANFALYISFTLMHLFCDYFLNFHMDSIRFLLQKNILLGFQKWCRFPLINIKQFLLIKIFLSTTNY